MNYFEDIKITVSKIEDLKESLSEIENILNELSKEISQYTTMYSIDVILPSLSHIKIENNTSILIKQSITDMYNNVKKLIEFEINECMKYINAIDNPKETEKA